MVTNEEVEACLCYLEMIGHIFRVPPNLNSTTPLCDRKDYGPFAEENAVPQMLSDLPETEVHSSAKLGLAHESL